MLGQSDLSMFYKENFTLKTHGNFSLIEIDQMLLFEREIYLIQLIDHLKEQNEMQENMTKKR